MESTTTPQGSIVVGVDGSEGSATALTWAAIEASRRQLPIHLVHAFAPDYPSLDFGHGFSTDMLRQSAEEILQAAIERLHSIDRSIPVTTATNRGYASAALVRASHRAAMVVLGLRGLGLLGSSVLGSVALQVAAHSPCPVVIVRREGARDQDRPRIVVGYDGSQRSLRAAEYAFERAQSCRGELVVVHTWWPADIEHAERVRHQDWDDYQRQQQDTVEQALSHLTERYPDVPLTLRILRGHPAQALVAEGEGADLLVVGKRGTGGFAGLNLGSVSHAVLRHAPCPVAILRAGDEDQQ